MSDKDDDLNDETEDETLEDEEGDLDLDDESGVHPDELEAELASPPDATPKKKGKSRRASKAADGEDEDEGVDLEEELHPDDVEHALDVMLAEKTTAEKMDDEEEALEDDDPEPEESGEGSGKIVPRRDDEFLCNSCFLVKPMSQRPDPKVSTCRDCV